MTDRNDMSSFGSAMNDMFRRLGLPDPLLVEQIKSEWEQLAGPPWVGRAKPVTIQGKTLVIEASSPSSVAFLRYAVSELLESIQTRLGPGVIDAIDVRGPGQ